MLFFAHLKCIIHLLSDFSAICASLKFVEWHDTCLNVADTIEHESEDCLVIVVQTDSATDIVSGWQAGQPAPLVRSRIIHQ